MIKEIIFEVGDLVKYRDKLPTDKEISGVNSPRSWGEIGIVCEAPLPWNRFDTKGSGVVYINAKNHFILAHRKDLIKLDQAKNEKLL